MKIETVGNLNILHFGKKEERTAIHPDVGALINHAAKNGEEIEEIELKDLKAGSEVVILKD